MNKLQYVSPETGTIILVAESLICESVISGSGTGDLDIITADPWTPIL